MHDQMQHYFNDVRLDCSEELELADKVGLDVIGIGEHHRAEFLDDRSSCCRDYRKKMARKATNLSIKHAPILLGRTRKCPNSKGCCNLRHRKA